MTDQPMFSIVIPTRNRADTLVHTLRTCLDQQFDDYEIIVADNFSSPETREVIDAAGSSKVHYMRSDRPLAMSANWELAVAQARGEYITVVGDDDGLMPFALRELARLAETEGRPQAIHWDRAIYTWPGIALDHTANSLQLPMSRSLRVRVGREQLRRVSDYALPLGALPMIYNAIIHRDLIARHRRIVGRVFPSIYPDIYSGMAFAFLAGTYLSLGVPMHIAGLSRKSNGVATIFAREPNPISEEFFRLQREAGLRHHHTVPDATLKPVHGDDSFQIAKDLLFPDDSELALDRKRMVERYMAAIPDTDPAARAETHQKIRATLADRPDLVEWFDNMPKNQPAYVLPPLKPGRLGLHGDVLILDTSRFGIQDISGAVGLAADLLGVGEEAIKYDQPKGGGGRSERARAGAAVQPGPRARTGGEHRASAKKAKGERRRKGVMRRLLALLRGGGRRR